uniref:3-hydroxyisobutyryl-CoA hydrolase n=1 Tax=Calcidiscus leptoporus TaxID=127549 RepID=A0A7S0J0Q1_9EUKA
MGWKAGACEEVLFHQRGTLAHIVLNRPKALNALTLGMARTVHSHLATAVNDSSIVSVMVSGMGGKAFCAGGDVKGVWAAAKGGGGPSVGAGGEPLPDAFFREEYALNLALATSRKPQVSVWDGLVMGGGAGLSVHGRFRVATQSALFAMPETKIGFFPDVGATSFLSALPGALGEFLGLTGERLRAADLLYTGLATHHVPSSLLPELQGALESSRSTDGVEQALAKFHTAVEEVAPLQGVREAIDRCFGCESVEAIEAALEREGSDWADGVLGVLRSSSAVSRKVTLRLLREARGKPLADCLRAEFRAAQAFMVPPSDFFEGIRAQLVDKDRQPKWSPSTPLEVDEEMLHKYFAPLASRELSCDENI